MSLTKIKFNAAQCGDITDFFTDLKCTAASVTTTTTTTTTTNSITATTTTITTSTTTITTSTNRTINTNYNDDVGKQIFYSSKIGSFLH